jgi:hypothetical protein
MMRKHDSTQLSSVENVIKMQGKEKLKKKKSKNSYPMCDVRF